MVRARGGDVSEGEYLRERNHIQAELAAMRPPQLPDLERAAAILRDFGAIWQAAMPEQQRAILRELLDAVYLDGEHGPVTAIQPKPHLAALFQVSRAGLTHVNHECDAIAVLMPGEAR